MRPYTHATQRSARLWLGDDLFQLVDEVPAQLHPEPIPIGEATELQLPEAVALAIHKAEAA